MVQIKKDIVTWLKQWFYTEDEVDTVTGSLQTQINNKANTSTVNALATTVNGKANKIHEHTALEVSDTQAAQYTGIGNNLVNGDTQQKINNSINSKLNSILSRITQLEGVEFVKIVPTLPNIADAEENKLYVVTGNNSSDGDDFGIYVLYGDQTHPNGAWERVDDAILKGFITEEDGDSRYSPLNHAHSLTEVALPSNIQLNNLGKSSAQVNNLALLFINMNNIVGNLSTKSETVGTTITLVDKGQTDEGCIIFNTVN